ncbi:hypothetical protein IMSHALPRED_010522 [Imshaugia aleurites]|uniref:Rhodopsin domain-containing protein n=1 Tax=Imshaugia aleurites TaxID=172621 RepID=A0A8H3G5M9_9LECA|nr:hypothetical protein IMSHALPRED_010522 [Imshaugia aleurites]
MASFVDITSYGHGAFKVIIVAAVLILMQILMVGGRFLSRKLRKVSLAADDYVLLTATIFTVGLCALALAFPRIAGIGDPAALTQMQEQSDSTILGQSYMAWLILYGLSIALSKCAILLLYVRVFTTSNKFFTSSVCLMGFVIIATGAANTFVAIFQCSPVAYEWNKSIQGGKCIDQVAFARYMAIPNVVTGAIMLAMPLPLSWKLNLTTSARIALTATFMHGIIGFIASCARLSIFFRTDASTFTNNISLLWTIWTIAEPANYTIAASLPTLRPIFQLLFPASFFVLSTGSRWSKRSSARNNKNHHHHHKNNNTDSINRSKTMQSPSSSSMMMRMSPLSGSRLSDTRRQGPWTGHGSLCEACGGDVEAGRGRGGSVGGGDDYYNNDINHNNNNNIINNNNNDNNNHEPRHAVMRAPGLNEGWKDDQVVVETMIQVSAADSYDGFF